MFNGVVRPVDPPLLRNASWSSVGADMERQSLTVRLLRKMRACLFMLRVHGFVVIIMCQELGVAFTARLPRRGSLEGSHRPDDRPTCHSERSRRISRNADAACVELVETACRSVVIELVEMPVFWLTLRRPFDGLRDLKLRERLRAQAPNRGFSRAMYISSLPISINPSRAIPKSHQFQSLHAA